MKDGFIFYASFQEAIKELPDKTKLLLYNAIADYALDDAEPDFGGNKIACAVFALVKPQIDANARRRDAGTKGGRPNREDQTDARKNQRLPKRKPVVLQTATKRKPVVLQMTKNKNQWFCS